MARSAITRITNQLTSGTDPAVARRLSDLPDEKLDVRINVARKVVRGGPATKHEDAATLFRPSSEFCGRD